MVMDDMDGSEVDFRSSEFESSDYDEGCYVDEFCGDQEKDGYRYGHGYRDHGSANNFDACGVIKRSAERRRSRHHQQRQSQQIGAVDLRNILAEFPGNHPVLMALRAISKLSHAAFMAIWLTVVLVSSVLGFIARVTVVAIEIVSAMLDWVGADY